MKNILEVKNLNKTVKDFKILNDITFSVPEGKICGFIGHNGAGKTTTIKSILSLFKYETGEIFIDGISSKKICASHKIIGYVPEKENFPKIKTITFLKMMADMYDISDAEFKKRLAYFTRVFSLKHQLNRNLNNLSSGEKKKIMITQALLHKPRLLIMDEPTENLDPDTRDIFYAILNKISKQWKSTIFVSTHNLDEIRNYINYLVIIVNGEIKEVKDYKKSEDIHKIYNKYKPKVKI